MSYHTGVRELADIKLVAVLPFVGPVIVIKSERHAVGLLKEIEEVKQRILQEVALEDVEVLKLAQCQRML